MVDVTGGDVRLCLFQGRPGEPLSEPVCHAGGDGEVRAPGVDPGGTAWSVTLGGATAGETPSVDLEVTFDSSTPSLILEGFRFQGSDAPAYNGFRAQLAARSAGPLSLAAGWNDGSDSVYPWETTLAGTTQTGEGASMAAGTAVSGAGPALVELRNTASAVPLEVRLRAELGWP